ncbi:hypothetical protein [Planctomyces sp. SH-PL62]|uniref:hypothetical protein n=1 Tax=Planctomyces sp. SH-PL62 TaxID=1636152 RepID=UPI00078CE294|nr:hypothetical protein [Planctomyces sp. SH-PL62]AMV36165.1 hypothetical protein VT85_01885 [Planctomyces sp. SH-PL62]
MTAGAGLADPSRIDPEPREIGDEPPDDWRLEGTTAAGPSRFLVGDYDDELASYVLVRPKDPQRVPFELRFDLVTQMRYTNFARSTDSWVDALGVRQPVRNFQTVEVNRNWVVFTGYGIDPRLQFNATIFSSTAFSDTVFMGWINYRFNRAFDLRAGNWNVPGTREWISSFRHTLGADRSMATTFFRPNISPGVWLQGEPITGLHYVAMGVGSLNRFLQNAGTSGPSGGFGGTIRWEPRGPFGLGTSDIENHQKLTPRLGFNTAFSREHNRDLGLGNLDNPENTIIRLSDGTPLSRLAANTPGVEISDVNFKLWTIDAALKYRGFGISGEYFLRRLDGFRYTGGRLPYRSLADHGGMLEAGYFLIPSKLEAFARTSYVSGQFGGGQEYGGGANWYPRGARTWRMTFEVLRIIDSPAQNILTGYRAGESGTLFQAQWLTDF